MVLKRSKATVVEDFDAEQPSPAAAPPKKAMGQFSYEEKVGREADLMNQFKTIIQSKGLGAEK